MKLLQIDSSPMGEAAITRQLTREFVKLWREAHSAGEVIVRDLTKVAIPVVDAAWISANYTPNELRTPHQHQLLKLSREFILELLEADEYVIGMPMHNWGPPASFKLWVDHIVTASSRLERPLAGTRITLSGKRATFIIAAGALYDPGSPNIAKDHLAPWLRTLFASLGLNDMRFIRIDGTRETNNGSVARAAFLAPHFAAVRAIFRSQELR